jgi:hypothetical protein
MKKLKLLSLSILCSLGTSVYAQQDVKVNISNVFLYEFNVNYEYLLNEYATVGGFGGYVYDFPGVDNPNQYWYLGPEFRYYVSPKNGADQFFIGLYSRIKSGKTYVDFYESGMSTNGFDYLNFYQNDQVNYTKLGIGFTCGGKWIAKNGFVYGVFGGIGRNLFANYDESSFVSHRDQFDPNSYYTSTDNYNDSKYWDFRIGFNVGWRLGK